MRISNRDEFDRENVFGLGQENTAFAQYFIGSSYLKPLTNPNETAVFLANVTFEPGCRNNWHIHHAKSGGGQLVFSYCSGGSRRGCKQRVVRACRRCGLREIGERSGERLTIRI